jgi:hypothetical protein
MRCYPRYWEPLNRAGIRGDFLSWKSSPCRSRTRGNFASARSGWWPSTGPTRRMSTRRSGPEASRPKLGIATPESLRSQPAPPATNGGAAGQLNRPLAASPMPPRVSRELLKITDQICPVRPVQVGAHRSRGGRPQCREYPSTRVSYRTGRGSRRRGGRARRRARSAAGQPDHQRQDDSAALRAYPYRFAHGPLRSCHS